MELVHQHDIGEFMSAHETVLRLMNEGWVIERSGRVYLPRWLTDQCGYDGEGMFIGPFKSLSGVLAGISAAEKMAAIIAAEGENHDDSHDW